MKALKAGAALLLLALIGCEAEQQVEYETRVSSPEDLAAHSEEFRKEVIEVTDGVYVAVGYGLANSILLEGDDGVVIVDTMETLEEAEAVMAEFAKIVDFEAKPVKAIIYTHNHADHIFGALAFSEGREVPVYAHATTDYYIDRILSVYRPIIVVRSMRMFGNYLDDAGLINDGIGPRLGYGPGSSLGVIRPTVTFQDELEDEVAGIRFKLVHAPGETNDQLFVWLPDKKVLLPGDNIYKAFPNLYTIRGTPYRDPMDWVDSLDKMRALEPEHLVPSHTRPVSGTDKINRILTDYRDGIAYVHDAAVRGINRGLTPDELVASIKLPPHLAESPYLQEFYGTVEWSLRSVFSGNLGWFDGNPTTLQPLPPDERARRYVELAGGEQALRDEVQQALQDGDHKWVLELTDYLLRLNLEDQGVRDVRAEALTRLGEAASNPNARHYYLTQALELSQGLEIPSQTAEPDPRMVHSFPLENYMRAMAVNLDPQDSADLEKTVTFVFPDAEEAWTVQVRRGVAEVREGAAEEPDLTASIDSKVFKEMLADLRNPAVVIAKDFTVEGSTLQFVKFMRMFKDPDEQR